MVNIVFESSFFLYFRMDVDTEVVESKIEFANEFIKQEQDEEMTDPLECDFSEAYNPWNVQNVTNMQEMFLGQTYFNQNLIRWNSKFKNNDTNRKKDRNLFDMFSLSGMYFGKKFNFKFNDYGNGGIKSITVTHWGEGYTSPPSITISGGGGSGATAIATISGSKISKISVTKLLLAN